MVTLSVPQTPMAVGARPFPGFFQELSFLPSCVFLKCLNLQGTPLFSERRRRPLLPGKSRSVSGGAAARRAAARAER